LSDTERAKLGGAVHEKNFTEGQEDHHTGVSPGMDSIISLRERNSRRLQSDEAKGRNELATLKMEVRPRHKNSIRHKLLSLHHSSWSILPLFLFLYCCFSSLVTALGVYVCVWFVCFLPLLRYLLVRLPWSTCQAWCNRDL
jgi:hypothetical protein